MLDLIVGLLGTASFGVFGWAFLKLEDHDNRLTALETSKLGLEQLINSRFDSVEKRLARIESKQDGDLHA